VIVDVILYRDVLDFHGVYYMDVSYTCGRICLTLVASEYMLSTRVLVIRSR